jgi:hypothetical protein
MSNEKLSELEKIILQVLKEMDFKKGRKGTSHMRWQMQEEVCKRYMDRFGMRGYEPERMSDNIKDHPEWEDNPKLNYFFMVEQGTGLDGTPYSYLNESPSFTEDVFSSIITLFRKGLVKIERTYQRNKVGCCGYVKTKQEDLVDEPRQLKDVQMVGLTERGLLQRTPFARVI